MLLSGPHGCGKTSSVYAIAKLLGYKVFEVNASSSRHKNQIIQELEGALNSHHVANNGSGNLKQANTTPNAITNILKKNTTTNQDAAKFKIDKFFNTGNFENHPSPVKEMKIKKTKKRKNSLRRETIHNLTNKINLNFSKRENHLNDDDDEENNEAEDSEGDTDDFFNKEHNKNHIVTKIPKNPSSKGKLPESDSSTSVNIQRESLILFDEIDVIFKEDVGFWSAILHFIKRSRKPILLTTTDQYLQDKVNLNVEKVDFIRPRTDAAVRYLKRIAKKENAELDTPTAYQILQNSGCDMRRALIQLQMYIVTSSTRSINLRDAYSASVSTLNLAKYLPSLLECTHTHLELLNPIFFLDQISKKIAPSKLNTSLDAEQFKKYDMVLLKDGLSDNVEGPAFNPFMPILPSNNPEPIATEDLVNTALSEIKEFYEFYMSGFNNKRLIRFEDWKKHGAVNQFSFASNSVLNKFAQYNYKLTSDKSLSLEYRPFLQQICQTEEIKYQESSKRRYLHYLAHYNIGVTKEDYKLLSISSLAPKIEINKTKSQSKRKSYKEEDLYSDGGG